LSSEDGRKLGSLCIIDTAARPEFSAADRRRLKALSSIVMDELELRLGRARSLLLANLSHEFRTPLNAVIGFADVMCREMMGPIGSESYRAYVCDIFNSGQRLLGLVDDLLDLAGTEPSKLVLHEENIPMREVVASVLQLFSAFANQRNVKVSNGVAGDHTMFCGDRRRLTQVVLNIVSNAIKFTPSGGSVSVSATRSADGGYALTVKDTGIGMSAELITKVMEPFPSQTGTGVEGARPGLGLQVCRELLHLHNGRLEIASAVQRGTAVSICLPATRIMG
jgi:signal transduction histidine kinase